MVNLVRQFWIQVAKRVVRKTRQMHHGIESIQVGWVNVTDVPVQRRDVLNRILVSERAVPVEIAIPMVMGANIGTTVTNTIVSLGMVRQGDDFKRAFAAATIHDFFNVLSVIIFLPLEVMFGVLEKMGAYLATLLVGGESMSVKGFNFIKPLVKPPLNLLKETFHGIGLSSRELTPSIMLNTLLEDGPKRMTS